MATTQDSALLSLYVYNVQRPLLNRPRLPTGWSELEVQPDDANGFSYGVFRHTSGEVVVAYTGTNQTIDWIGNLGAGGGLGAQQVTSAALVYLRARDVYGSNITFSGHSLGGGLASIMSVWFNRPAEVFDHAPFELTARNPIIVLATKVALLAAGYELGEFAAYNEIVNFAIRELNVSGNHLSGEALEYLRLGLPTIGGSQPLSVGSGLGAVDLHSMALYTAAKLSPAFTSATFVSDRILPLVFDAKLYGYNTGSSTERNFLLDLIRSEQQNSGNGKLTHFAADLNKLGTNITGLNQAAQNALIAQGIEWYYWQGTDYPTKPRLEFISQTGSLLQYTTAIGDGLTGALNKAVAYTTKWLTAVQGEYGQATKAVIRVDYDQWNIATGTSGSTATAREVGKSQIFIGQGGADIFTGGDKDDLFFAGNGDNTVTGGGGNDVIYGGTGVDSLDGGEGNDQLYGGAGDDILIGGAGNDVLQGGADNDTYKFDAAWGKDVITDSDGKGSITIGGQALGTAQGAGKTNVWVTELGAGSGQYVGMALYDDASSSTGKKLMITKDTDTSNTIVINNFDLSAAYGASYLGIKLDKTQHIFITQGNGAGFTVSLAVGAKKGDTVRLAVNGALSGKLKARVNGDLVDAGGASQRARLVRRISKRYVFNSFSRIILLVCRPNTYIKSATAASQLKPRLELALNVGQV